MADMSDPFAGRPIPPQRGGGAGAVHAITEELIVRVLDPACAEFLVGQVVRVLEDRQTRHQPRRKRRLTGLVRIDRPEPLLQKPPVDRRGQPRQRVAQVDDLVEPGLEQIVLTALPTLLRPHRESLRRRPRDGRESRRGRPHNLQVSRPIDPPILQKRILRNPRKPPQSGHLTVLHRRRIRLRRANSISTQALRKFQ